MLILTRRVTESVIIGKDIIVTVLSVNGSQVRIGVDAPKNIVVHRQEVYAQIRAANRAAANPVADLAALSRRILQQP